MIKNFIVIAAIALCTTLGLMAAQIPGQAGPGSQRTLIQPEFLFSQQENPYCGKKGEDFPHPDVVCPPDKEYEIDESCLTSCNDQWVSEILAAYNTACTQQGNALLQYRNCVQSALAAYDECMASATTTQQQMACKASFMNALDSCNSQLQTAKNAIAISLNAARNIAKANFQSCASNCCVPKNP